MIDYGYALSCLLQFAAYMVVVTIGLFSTAALFDVMTSGRPSTTGTVSAPRRGESSTGGHHDYTHPVFDIEVQP